MLERERSIIVAMLARSQQHALKPKRLLYSKPSIKVAEDDGTVSVYPFAKYLPYTPSGGTSPPSTYCPRFTRTSTSAATHFRPGMTLVPGTEGVSEISVTVTRIECSVMFVSEASSGRGWASLII